MIKSASQSSLTNDVKYRNMGAANVPSNEYLIQTTILSTTASSIVFNNLDQHAGVYRHLMIAGVALSGSGEQDLTFLINGGGTYKVQLLYGRDGSVQSVGGIDTSYGSGYLGYMAGGGGGSLIGTGFIADIPDAFNTNKNKVVKSLSGSSNIVMFNSSVLMSTAAISSIQISARSSNFPAGSRFSLYGVTA